MSALSLVVLVTGGRDYNDYQVVDRALSAMRPELDTVIHGDCRTGLDRVAGDWCRQNGVHAIAVPALWDYYRKLGRGKVAQAGPIRNDVLVELARRLDVYRVLVFPGNAGTRDCANRARAAGLRVEEVR